MKKKILLTGARGILGKIIRKELKEYSFTPLDLPEVDIKNYDQLIKLLPGHDIIMHFAWDSKHESSFTAGVSTDNSLMANNIYRAAIETDIPRVIMASSIHADDYNLRESDELLSPYRLPSPKDPYGATKVYIEALGRYYAKQKLEVVCLRLGSITTNNNPYNLSSSCRFLTHNDFRELLVLCIEAKNVPNNYTIIYGVSNNTGRIHNIENPFGWVPKENASDKIIKR